MLSKITKLVEVMIRVLLLVETLLKVFLWRFTVRPAGFGDRVQIKETGSGMSKLFTYKQALLPIPEDRITNQGIVSQRLQVTVNGVEQPVPAVVDVRAESIEFKAGPVGASVDLKLDCLDAEGNDSNDVTVSFVVIDGVAPDAPEGFGELTQIAEEEVPDV